MSEKWTASQVVTTYVGLTDRVMGYAGEVICLQPRSDGLFNYELHRAKTAKEVQEWQRDRLRALNA